MEVDEEVGLKGATNAQPPNNGKWWHLVFHNVAAVGGVAVLDLPHAMAGLGWGPGVTVLVLSWIISLYTLGLIVEMNDTVSRQWFERYQREFGNTLPLYIVVSLLLIAKIGVDISCMVTVGKSLRMFHDTVCSSCGETKTTYFIIIFACASLVLSHLRNFKSTAGVSLAAALMFFGYCTIVCIALLHEGGCSDQRTIRVQSDLDSETALNVFSALGIAAYPYGEHHVAMAIMAIQEMIPSTQRSSSMSPSTQRPLSGLMWRDVVVAYIIVALCYFPVALIGYLIFGNSVEDNILVSLEKPAWLVALAYMLVVGHAIGSFQISTKPMFDMIAAVLETKWPFEKLPKFTAPYIYVASTMLIAITFPFFGDLLWPFGGALTIYILPCLMRLAIDKYSGSSSSQWKNWMCIAIGVLLMVLVPIGALRQIINEAKTYQFYS
ncbi:lysine histidine transporter 1-like [Eucalyptus grandis]|uniref:lysine histidine transporter 1-like n=1 Tax=Eucalyptus grandis TaxID=71139 RepID=UPI00192EC3A2|nr:lysine histidine transporter 1-like [Eucalyptus grandis]